MRLTQEVDESEFGLYLRQHRGDTVKLADLHDLISSSFGSNNASKIRLSCKDGVLVDVLIRLPALMPFDEPLLNLINDAPAASDKDHCSREVILSDFAIE
jgi:ribonuclease T2